MTRKKLSKWEIFERVAVVIGLIGFAFGVYAYYFPISNTVYVAVPGWTVTDYRNPPSTYSITITATTFTTITHNNVTTILPETSH